MPIDSQARADVTLEWSLTGEGMGVLERAGLAGLFMSLSAADDWARQGEERACELKKVLAWKLGDDSVRLSWKGAKAEKTVLKKLVGWSWQIRDGVYYLPGVHCGPDARDHWHLRVHTHSGLLGTFLQSSGQLKPKAGNATPGLVEVDCETPRATIAIRYRPFATAQEPRQCKAVDKICPLHRKGGAFRAVEMASWLYPGAARRFGKGEEDWKGPANVAFILLFCAYRLPLPKAAAVRRQVASGGRTGPSWFRRSRLSARCQENTPSYRPRCKSNSTRSPYQGWPRLGCGSPWPTAAVTFERRLPSPTIHVTAMGSTGYYSSDPRISTRVRKMVMRVTPSATSIARYGSLLRVMPNRLLKRKPAETEQPEQSATHWLWEPTARGRIAENLIDGLPWYGTLLRPPIWQLGELENIRRRQAGTLSIEELWFRKIQQEWKQLRELIGDSAMWDDSREEELVKLFHGTLRRLLSNEEEALKRGGSRKLHDRWGHRVDDIRRGLTRAKTQPLTRKFLAELLADGGGTKSLTEHRKEYWTLVNHPYDWEKLRDLALLALVTFTDKRLAKAEVAQPEPTGDDDE